jgi:RNA polymerase sigma-70 factor (ECF subfamily)
MSLDRRTYDDLARRHRRELHVHCYRLLANAEEADEAVQETYLKAWQRRETFEGVHARAWLYRIATNVCLDELRRRKRRVPVDHSFVDLPWLEPYPDRLLDEVLVSPDDGPDDVVVARETVELAYLAALQVLPPKQRAVLALRDVLGWSAAETAEALDTSVAAANSALQRARATMATQLPSHRTEWASASPSEEEQALLAAFIDAHERQDADAALAVAHQDLRITMPPLPLTFDGLTVIRPALRTAFGPESDGDWRVVPTAFNRMPAAACYLRRPGETEFSAFKVDVLRVEEGKVAEITTFGLRFLLAAGLPEVLPG